MQNECVSINNNTISVRDMKHNTMNFTYDMVLGKDVGNQEVFERLGTSICANCLECYNASIFAYGQTGAGKTHTITGDLPADFNEEDILDTTQLYSERGFAPRLFETLFSMIEEQRQEYTQGVMDFQIRCSFLEIYNENVYDLLSGTEERRPLKIIDHYKRGAAVEHLTEPPVHSSSDLLYNLLTGLSQRKVGETKLNTHSSRSHSVFTINFEKRQAKDKLVITKHAKLNLIDLAGSENQKLTEATGQRFREATNINTSLLELGRVISSLYDKTKGKISFVNYRNSKLTFLLKDSLGGNSKTTIITCVTPCLSNYKETISALQFADRAKQIQNHAMVNEDCRRDDKIRVKELEEENRRLRLENAKFLENKEFYSQINFESDDYVEHNVLSHMRAMNEVEVPTSEPRSPTTRNIQEKNKELSVLKGIVKYNERMKTYEKHIEEITELKNMLVTQKDEHIHDLSQKIKDQNEEMKKMAKILNLVKAENKRTFDKYQKWLKENAPPEYKAEIEQITNEIKLLTSEKLRHVGTEAIYFDNEKLKKENEELRKAISAVEVKDEHQLAHVDPYENKLRDQVMECISDRDQVTKSVQEYISALESGDMMKRMEAQIDASIREHYEVKMADLNKEFDRIMFDKDTKAQKDKETYEQQLDTIISEIDAKEAHKDQYLKKLESERDLCRKEANELAQQLALFKNEVEKIAAYESEEKVKVKNNYELKLSELYNNNSSLAESNATLTEQMKALQKLVDDQTTQSTRERSEEAQMLSSSLQALKEENESLNIALNEKNAMIKKINEEHEAIVQTLNTSIIKNEENLNLKTIEISNLQDKINEYYENINNLKEEMSQQKSDHENSLRTVELAANDQLIKLNANHDSAIEAIQKSKNENEIKIQSLNEQLQDLSSSNNILSNEIETYKSTIKLKDESIKSLQSTIQENESKIKLNESTIQDNVNKIKQYEANIQENENMLKKNDETIQDYERNFKYSETKIQEYENNMKKNEEIIQIYENKIKQFETNIQDYENKINQNLNSIKEYENKVKQNQTIIYDNEIILKQKVTLIEEKDVHIQDMTSKYDLAISENNKLKNEIADLEMKQMQVAKDLSATKKVKLEIEGNSKEKETSLVKFNEELLAENQQLKDQVLKLNEVKQQAQVQLEKSIYEIQQATRSLEEQSAAKHTLEEQLGKLNDTIKDLTQQSETLSNENENLKIAIEKVNSILDKSHEEYNQLYAAQQQSKKEIQSLYDTIKAVEEEKASLQAQIVDISNEKANLESNLEKINQEFTNTHAAVNEKSNENQDLKLKVEEISTQMEQQCILGKTTSVYFNNLKSYISDTFAKLSGYLRVDLSVENAETLSFDEYYLSLQKGFDALQSTIAEKEQNLNLLSNEYEKFIEIIKFLKDCYKEGSHFTEQEISLETIAEIIAELLKNFNKKVAQAAQYQAEFDQQKELIEEMRTKIATLTEENSNLLGQCNQTRSELDLYINSNQNDQKKINELETIREDTLKVRTEYEELKNQYKEIQNDKEQMQVNLNKYITQINELQLKNNTSDQSLIQANEKYTKSTEECKKVKEEVDKLKKLNSDFSGKTSEMIAKYEEMQVRCDELETNNKIRQDELNMRIQEAASAREEYTSKLKEQQLSFESEIEAQKQQIESISTKLIAVTKECNDLKKRLEDSNTCYKEQEVALMEECTRNKSLNSQLVEINKLKDSLDHKVQSHANLIKEYVSQYGSEYQGSPVSDIKDVVSILSSRLKVALQTKGGSEQKLESLENQVTLLQAQYDEAKKEAEELEVENTKKANYILCIQRDCEQVVTAKEEWLQVMRSFKESEEKVYNKYKNLRKCYELFKTECKDLKVKNGDLQLKLDEALRERVNAKHVLKDEKGSVNDNIKRFNDLRWDLAEMQKENVRLKNEQVDTKNLNRTVIEYQTSISKIRETLAIKGGKEPDVRDIIDYVNKIKFESTKTKGKK